MKRITSLFLALLLCLTLAPTLALPRAEAESDVPINATIFPDAAFRSYVSSDCDTNGDGVLSSSEIAAVTQINVKGRGISSLTGIQYFTAMTFLDCGSNDLTSLDVSTNTALEILFCTTNQLKELDLSKNTALRTLSCGDNKFTSLDLRKNTALKVLSCGSNYQLQSINVRNLKSLKDINLSGDTALETLSCSGCALTKLEVSSCTALTHLSCYNNDLTELRVYNNKQLTYLDCDDNQLTSLGVSCNTALETLNCCKNQLTTLYMDKNTALKELRCYDNQLTNLDVSANTALTTLDCDDNALTELDVSANTALTTLNCSGNNLFELDVSKNTGLEYLRCYSNGLTSLNISKNPALKYLDCEYNDIEEVNISACPKLVDAYLNGERKELNGTSGVFIHYSNSQGDIYADPTTEINTVAPPVITTQPRSVSQNVGTTAKFTVAAAGESLSYQWQYNGGAGWKNCTMTGYNTATLSVPVTAARNGYKYRCVVSNASDSVTSSAAKLTVKTKITAQPTNQSGYVGGTAKFTVTATGAGLKYKWQFSADGKTWKDSTLTGYNTATMSVPITAARNGYQYRCKVSSVNGAVLTSSAAKLTVKTKITAQPKSVTQAVGTTAKFTVTATGAGLKYQWQYRTSSTAVWKNSTLTGYNTATMSVPVTAARNKYQYRCVITDANGAVVNSTAATLTVKATITSQPKSVTQAAGTTAKFTVTATGAGLAYQWQYRTSSTASWKNSTLTGYNTAAMSVPVTAARNGYQYRCVISDANGAKITSAAAKLTVK